MIKAACNVRLDIAFPKSKNGDASSIRSNVSSGEAETGQQATLLERDGSLVGQDVGTVDL